MNKKYRNAFAALGLLGLSATPVLAAPGDCTNYSRYGDCMDCCKRNYNSSGNCTNACFALKAFDPSATQMSPKPPKQNMSLKPVSDAQASVPRKAKKAKKLRQN